MDEFILSSSSLLSASQHQPASLQQRLQPILDNQRERWTYAIFWQTSTDDEGCIFLTWGDGFFQGTTVIKEIQGLIVENYSDSHSNIVNDAERFYVKSLANPLSLGDGVPGKAFSTGSVVWLSGGNQLGFQNCERAREAQIHGVQTLVCIPTSNGVVELGSNVIITQNWSVVRQVKCSFESDLYGLGLVSQKYSKLGTNPDDIDVLSQIQEDAQQKMTEALPVSKISDSTSQFKTPKKRGRKPSIGRPNVPLINHVDAERHRREKLTRAFCKLQSVVPYASTMDRASLLSAAVLYIKELKEKVEELESKRMKMKQLEIEVKIVGEDGMIRVQSENTNYPVTRLIDVIRDLELQVHHASMSSVKNLMLQDVVVKVPGGGGITSEDALRTALVTGLEK